MLVSFGMNVGISSAIKDPAIIDACWKFIRFMGSDAAKKIAVDTLLKMVLVDIFS